jgi:Ala-tRNA(Pro) deacylase
MLEKEQKVYDVLNKLELPYTRYEHEAVYTVDAANKFCGHIPGQHCKNIFVRNAKGNKHYLIIIDDVKKVDLKNISRQIESSSLSFASEERLKKYLGVEPGSVSAFGLINDIEKSIEVLLDKDFVNADIISFHPNVNTATLTITYQDFKKFLECCGNKVSYVEI